MDPNQGMDAIAEWTLGRQRVSELVAGLDEERLDVRVPACPDWTARDLLAHMVGLAADVVGGDEPDDHNATWTQAQVDARRGRTGAELLAEWDGLAEPLKEWMREHGTRPLNDVVIHEQDLRGAVGEPGGRGTEGLGIVRDRMAGRLAERLATRPDLLPLALVGDSWRWASDGGDPADAATELRAGDHDLFRALTSRRTAGELRAMTVRGDVTPYLDALAGLGPLPEEPLRGG